MAHTSTSLAASGSPVPGSRYASSSRFHLDSRSRRVGRARVPVQRARLGPPSGAPGSRTAGRCVSPTTRAYWSEIQRAFDADRTLINLNNGGVSPTPTHVLEAMIRDLRFSNEVPVEHMWGVLEPRIESVRRELAKEFGCDPEEMAITRNASESNETMIFGLDLKRGDEVIVTTQNYGRMITTWDQRARRDGIVVKQIKFKVPPPSDEYIVNQFREAITPRTRVIEITHITNLTGQILPVRQGRGDGAGEGNRGVRGRRACLRAFPVHAR